MTLARWPLVARVALLLGALSAAGLALLGLRTPPAGSVPGYTCPMHPEVRRGEPGDCPVCGMALVRVAPPAAERTADAAVRPRLPPGAIEVSRRRVLTERRSVPAWVDAQGKIQALVPAEEVPHLAADERAEFRARPDPVPRPVRRGAAPAVPHDEATSRVEFETLGSTAPSGAVGWLSLSDRTRAAVILPSAAVLLSEEGPAVLVPARGPAGVERRPVRLGQSPDGLAVVVSGLEENERVVVRGAFFLDAERRLSASAAPVR
ncbi:MAG: heavy metal-binding domain-containing protein [Myxococcaceae bacterium]